MLITMLTPQYDLPDLRGKQRRPSEMGERFHGTGKDAKL